MGFHPGKEAIDVFADRFGKPPHTQSTLHLPCNQPVSRVLLQKMVAFCMEKRLK